MPTRTVKRTDRLNASVEGAVASGRFLDDGDVIREGVHLLALREWEDGAVPASPLPAGAPAWQGRPTSPARGPAAAGVIRGFTPVASGGGHDGG